MPTSVRRRVAVTFLDQFVSSMSNFATGLAVARLSGPAQFGRYMLVVTIWFVVVGVHRALVTDPVIVISGDTDARRALLAQGVSAELLLGAIVSAGVGGAGLAIVVMGFDIGELMLALSPWFVSLLVQDYWRAMAFQQRRPGVALINDSVFAAVQLLAIGLCWIAGWHSPSFMFAAWGIGATAGALLGFRSFRGITRPRAGLSLVGRLWPVSRWMLADFVTGFASQQAYLAFLALFLSHVDYGGFRAAFNLMGPSVVIVHAGANIGLPEASRRAAESSVALQGFARRMTAATTLCIAGYGVAVAICGELLLNALYGAEYTRFAPLATLAALQYVFMVSVFGQATAMKAAGQVRPLWRARVLVAVASLTCTVFLVGWLGTPGAAWAGVLTGLFYAGAVYTVYRTAMKRPTARENELESLSPRWAALRPAPAAPDEAGV